MTNKRDLSEALVRIYNAAYSPAAWGDAMEACRLLARAEHTAFHAQTSTQETRFSARGGSPSIARFEPELIEYNRLFLRADNTGYDDVGQLHMANTEVARPVFDTEIWSLEWLRRRREIQFLRDHLGVFRKLYVNISSDPLMIGVAMFLYSQDKEDIPEIAASQVRLVGPHLHKALDLARWGDSLRRKYNAMLGVLDKLELGVCILDTCGRVVLSNRYAEDVFSERDAIWLSRAKAIQTRSPDKSSELSFAVSQVSSTAEGLGQANSIEITVPREGNPSPLLAIVSPLRDADSELEVGLSGSLITIIDTDRTPNLRLQSFGTSYGLTKTERRVASLLVTGLTTNQIAEELGVAQSTAQSHLKAIFSKTRSNNRVSFVWKAIQFMPPVL